MKRIVITTESFFEGEADAINLLFENGLMLLHLRKPHATHHETESFIRQMNKDYHSRIVIHDNYDLANLFGLKGIHLNHRNLEGCNSNCCAHIFLHPVGMQSSVEENDTSSLHAVGMLQRQIPLSISRSCHSFQEVLESPFYDYVFLSPIFDSISKSGYKQAFTSKQLMEAKAAGLINEKVIALGGITTDNIPTARAYGFGGVAVLGSLWGNFPIDRNMNELMNRFHALISK